MVLMVMVVAVMCNVLDGEVHLIIDRTLHELIHLLLLQLVEILHSSDRRAGFLRSVELLRSVDRCLEGTRLPPLAALVLRGDGLDLELESGRSIERVVRTETDRRHLI